MTFELDSLIPTTVGEPYVLKSDHRTGGHDKSQWIIEREEEIRVFEYAYDSKWLSKTNAWGLYLPNGQLWFLGRSAAKEPVKQNLWIAKFVQSLTPFFWHGYPADYRRKIHDRPDSAILKNWYDKGHIRKHDISRIRCGKKSSLSD